MKKPKNLAKGSVVRIISTARKISREELQPAMQLVEDWGLNVELGSNVFEEFNQFAGSFDQRVRDLQDALDDPTVDAIWCSRGGYGTTMLLDSIDFTRFVEHPKWVIGYSDITSLLNHITSNFDIATLHATMPINIKKTVVAGQISSSNTMKDVLFGTTIRYQLPDHSLNISGSCSGPIIGGNLSILYSLLGSVSSPKTSGCILFLEDLDEYLYHIDRMMVNLKRNEMFEKLSGVVIGGLSDMNDNSIPYGMSAEEIIHSHLKEYSFPVFFGFSAGHVSPNLALPFGINASIENHVLTINF